MIWKDNSFVLLFVPPKTKKFELLKKIVHDLMDEICNVETNPVVKWLYDWHCKHRINQIEKLDYKIESRTPKILENINILVQMVKEEQEDDTKKFLDLKNSLIESIEYLCYVRDFKLHKILDYEYINWIWKTRQDPILFTKDVFDKEVLVDEGFQDLLKGEKIDMMYATMEMFIPEGYATHEFIDFKHRDLSNEYCQFLVRNEKTGEMKIAHADFDFFADFRFFSYSHGWWFYKDFRSLPRLVTAHFYDQFDDKNWCYKGRLPVAIIFPPAEMSYVNEVFNFE